jgi:hypothetical protein
MQNWKRSKLQVAREMQYQGRKSALLACLETDFYIMLGNQLNIQLISI